MLALAKISQLDARSQLLCLRDVEIEFRERRHATVVVGTVNSFFILFLFNFVPGQLFTLISFPLEKKLFSQIASRLA
jgi:hypothetical protein